MSSFTLDDLRKDAPRQQDDPAPKPSSFTLTDLKSDAYKKGRAESDPLFRGIANTINGPTFGFGDEISGAVLSAPLSLVRGQGISGIPQGYRDVRDFVRGAQDQYKEDFPIGSTATQLAASAPTIMTNPLGAVATRAAPANVTRWVNAPRTGATGLAVRSGIAGASGAGYGGITGAGESTADDLMGLTLDTGKGALVSGALGAAAPGVGALGMGAYGQIGPRLSENAAMNFARQKVAEAFSRDGRGSVFESGVSNAGSQAAAKFARLGPEARIVDAGGQNTRQLLDTTATLPGRTKNLVENAIHERQATRGGRLIQAADEQMGVNGQRLNEGVQGWADSRRMQATPLYAELRQMTINPTENLAGVVQAANSLGAGTAARRIATAERVPFTLNPQGPNQWSMRDLDLLKQGMDDLIARNTDAATGSVTPFGRSLVNLNNALKSELDQLTTRSDGTSLYRAARDAYAGPSALIDAANTGRRVFQQDEAAIRQAMNGLAGSEAEAFRLGAFEALRGKLGKMSGQTEILNMWRDSATREKLQAVFGSERNFRQFAATAGREQRLKGLEQVGRGSQTASRQYGAGDLDINPALQAATAATQGSPTGLLAAGANIWNRVRTPERTRDQIGQLLLSRDPVTMRELELLTPLVTAERNRRAAMSGAYTGLLAN